MISITNKIINTYNEITKLQKNNGNYNKPQIFKELLIILSVYSAII